MKKTQLHQNERLKYENIKYNVKFGTCREMNEQIIEKNVCRLFFQSTLFIPEKGLIQINLPIITIPSFSWIANKFNATNLSLIEWIINKYGQKRIKALKILTRTRQNETFTSRPSRLTFKFKLKSLYGAECICLGKSNSGRDWRGK